MNFIGLFKKRPAENKALTSGGYSFFFSPTSAGKPVTERSAMQMTAVYACARILSEAIAGLPMHVYRYKDGGGKEKAGDHGLYRLLHDEPNPEMTSFVFRETLMTHLLLWGNAFAQIVRNGLGEVIGLYPLQPNRMSVGRDLDSTALYYEYQTSRDEPARQYQTIRLTPNDVFPLQFHASLLSYDQTTRQRECHDRSENPLEARKQGPCYFILLLDHLRIRRLSEANTSTSK